LHELIENGALATNTSILADRPTQSDTVSGPGWASIVTGVWSDKHGVQDNSLEYRTEFEPANFDQFPHFFRRIKDADPQARTGSFVSWKPIGQHMLTACDVSFEPAMDDGGDDDLTIKAAVEFISRDNPTAVFVHLLHVDHVGHGHGFHPTVSQYIEAIEHADRHVGELIQAVRERESYDSEDWLILVGTDHGGKGTTHQQGRNEPEVTKVFLIVSGKSAQRGRIERPTFIVNLPATALSHLEVPIQEAWQLDGRPVGLK
jgi:predicted AlkP superfamily pyrophosphatase or phosphodiesterase